LITGTDVKSGGVQITKRKYIGDNNANDRLDVGDASIIMRLITGAEQRRTWDTAANDLNKNLLLDSGDVIKVLRAVVGLDAQPGGVTGQSLKASSIQALSANNATVSLDIDKQRAAPGDKVKVTVHLSQMTGVISGASFKLDYPVSALRLDSVTAHRTGVMVPATATVLWNLSPTNNYAAQDGTIRLAVTTPGNWPTNSGALAEFTFTVQDTETNQYRWPITVSQLEFSSGFNLVTAADASTSFVGRDPLPASFEGGGLSLTNGQFQISLSGEIGAHYKIEVSDDLETWTELTTVLNASGQIQATDPAAGQKDHRFYRATQVD